MSRRLQLTECRRENKCGIVAPDSPVLHAPVLDALDRASRRVHTRKRCGTLSTRRFRPPRVVPPRRTDKNDILSRGLSTADRWRHLGSYERKNCPYRTPRLLSVFSRRAFFTTIIIFALRLHPRHVVSLARASAGRVAYRKSVDWNGKKLVTRYILLFRVLRIKENLKRK